MTPKRRNAIRANIRRKRASPRSPLLVGTSQVQLGGGGLSMAAIRAQAFRMSSKELLRNIHLMEEWEQLPNYYRIYREELKRRGQS